MDIRLTQLARQAQNGDPHAVAVYEAALGRAMGFTPRDGINKRTTKRWRAHLNNRCNDKCRFCRRGQKIG